MVICSDLALPVAHYNQHRKLQDAAFSTEGPPVKEGACLHAVETVNSRLADTCRQFGDIWIYVVRTSDIFLHFISLCACPFHLRLSVREFSDRAGGSSLPGQSQQFEGFKGDWSGMLKYNPGKIHIRYGVFMRFLQTESLILSQITDYKV